MVAGTEAGMVDQVDTVLDIKKVVGQELGSGRHAPKETEPSRRQSGGTQNEIKEQLEDLGYM
jgi:hypothetical protein